MLFMGIDAGTQGVRAMVTDESGAALASGSVAFARLNSSDVSGRYEQRPADWWDAAKGSIGQCLKELKDGGRCADDIRSISIDGTSGTLVPLDGDGEPLSDALMYNDLRASEEAKLAREECGALCEKLGYSFNASFSLPRALWIMRSRPDVYEKTAAMAHQADYLVGKLTGIFNVSDYSNALKTGYDLIDDCWPECFEKLSLDRSKFPKIVAPGAPIGNVSAKAAKEIGLSEKTMVVGGSTDGYASALAAGALRVGDWASIIGTTLVLKGVTDKLIIDPSGSSYSHKLPSGAWMLGGASSVGGRCLNARFDKSEFDGLNKTVDSLTPTGVVMYPLTGTGERFPFVDPDAKEFIVGDTGDKRVLYAALMEGVAFAERLCYERMEAMGASVGDTIYTSGGACKSAQWLRVRANMLGRRLRVPAVVEAAMGSAMVAASYELGSLENAAGMLSFVLSVEPDKEKAKRYDELYAKFYQECEARYKL